MALSKSNERARSIITNSIVNTMRNASELAVQQAKYDKTILATIQYCTDVTLQQYKIKYQDGYYVAYGDPSSGKTYAKNASVYVVVPGNDLSGKLRITGTASDDNSNLISTSAMVRNQRYKVKTSSFLVPLQNEGLYEFLSYDVGAGEDQSKTPQYMFRHSLGDANTYYTIQSKTSSQQQENYETRVRKVYNEIQNSEIDCLRISAKFCTKELTEEQKIGNYGIGVDISCYPSEDKIGTGETELLSFTLDTFNMDGAPYEFNTYVTKSEWFEINYKLFHHIENVYVFAKGFNSGTSPDPEVKADIHIKEIAIEGGFKLYDLTDTGLRINIQEIDSKSNTFDPYDIETDAAERNYRAELLLQGNPVDETSQSVNFYWGIEDNSVDSIGNLFYQEELGQGWRCVNNYTIEKTKSGLVPFSSDTNIHKYDGFSDIDSDVSKVTRIPSSVMTFAKKYCKGRITKFRCAAKYEGNIVQSDIMTLVNPDGGYIVLYATDTSFYGGNGSFSIVANVFRDEHEPDLPNQTRHPRTRTKIDDNRLHFVWSYRDSASEVNLPNNSINRYLVNAEWDETKDNVEISDPAVADYLRGRDDLASCRERYTYYKNYIEQHKDSEDTTIQGYVEVAKTRFQDVVDKRNEVLDKGFVEANDNIVNSEILGMATISLDDTQIYQEGDDPIITGVTYNYYVDEHTLPADREQRNTLYKVQSSSIQGAQRTYTVSAFLKKEYNGDVSYDFIGSKTLEIASMEASSLKYDLEIVGGNQAFIYDVGGKSPASKQASSPITIQPLTFKLRESATGKILYDSSIEDDQTEETSVNVLTAADLSPVWYYPGASDSMLTTLYLPQDGSDCYYDENEKLYAKKEEKSFNFGLAEDYNPDLKDKNEIQLVVKFNETTNENNETVLIQGNQQVVRATTHFNFAKDGELGTNGTNMYLDIVDLTYEEYKDGVLSAYNKVPIRPDGREDFKQVCPNARFLRDTYLYATQSYDSNKNRIINSETLNLNNAKYVNLLFGRRAQNTEGYPLIRDNSATLDAFWYENGSQGDPISNKCKWGTNEKREVTRSDGDYTFAPSFSISPEVGSGRVTLDIERIQDYPELSYRPTGFIGFSTRDQKTYTRMASNIIKCSDYKEIPGQVNEVSQLPVERENFGYYAIPYFYYHYYKQSEGAPEHHLDPARQIYITGGFSEVYYKEDGSNPIYNKEPFRVTVFDKDNNDISNLFEFEWVVSPGLTAEPKVLNPNNIPEYGDPALNGVDLKDKLVKVDNTIYRCTKDNHTQDHGDIKVNDIHDTIYYATTFVRPYYEIADEAVYNGRECTITPADKYATQAVNSLFNSYIIVRGSTVRNTPDGYTYEIEAMLPISMYLNKYGSKAINGWDGQQTKVGDQYIISPQVAAGYKNEDNSFVGITIGTNMYNPSTGKNPETGIFGYGNTMGQTVGQESNWGRTLFIDAKTGRAIFGASGAGQIILDPTLNGSGTTQNWSRLAGWYFNSDYLYKPLGEYRNLLKMTPDEDFSHFAQGAAINPPKVTPTSSTYCGSVGLYCPGFKQVKQDDKFIWASAKYDLSDNPDAQDTLDKIDNYKRQLNEQYGITFDSAGNITNYDARMAYYDNEYKVGVTKEQLTLDYKDNKRINSPDIEIIPVQGRDYYQFKDFGKIAVSDWVVWQETIDGNAIEIQRTEQISEEAAFAKACDQMREYFVNDDQFGYRKMWAAMINIDNLIHLYNDARNEYNEVYVPMTNDKNVVDYRTATNKTSKPNFYVTYGGKMHCNMAEVTGKITANSGSFGTTGNKVEINVLKERDSDLGAGRYVLWNKNFKMKDDDGRHGPAMAIKGRIMAESGQIGKVGNDIDGKSSNTLFIEYDWYPWRLPQNRIVDEVPAPEPGAKIGHAEPWSNEYFHLQDTQGQIEKYALYHKNFYIKNNGEVVLQGKIYSKEGRIGDWIIDGSVLRSATDNHESVYNGLDGILFNPGRLTVAKDAQGNPYAEDCHPDQSYIWVGNVRIRGDGTIGGYKYNDQGNLEALWSIDKNGVAHVNNVENILGGTSVTVYGNSGGSWDGSDGLSVNKLTVSQEAEFWNTVKDVVRKMFNTVTVSTPGGGTTSAVQFK